MSLTTDFLSIRDLQEYCQKYNCEFSGIEITQMRGWQFSCWTEASNGSSVFSIAYNESLYAAMQEACGAIAAKLARWEEQLKQMQPTAVTTSKKLSSITLDDL